MTFIPSGTSLPNPHVNLPEDRNYDDFPINSDKPHRASGFQDLLLKLFTGDVTETKKFESLPSGEERIAGLPGGNGENYATSSSQSAQAETLYVAQHLGQQETARSTVVQEPLVANANQADPTQEFRDYMSKTPEERYFDSFLAEEGLTREEFENLPPDERLKIEAKILEKIKEMTAKKVAGDTNQDHA